MWNNTPPSKEHEYDAMEKDCGDMTNFRRPPYYMIKKQREEVKTNEKAESRIKTQKTRKKKQAEKTERKKKTWETKNSAKEPKK